MLAIPKNRVLVIKKAKENLLLVMNQYHYFHKIFSKISKIKEAKDICN
jgi:CO dehydrogenase/acetyl-CoA synthase epsilon subunit